MAEILNFPVRCEAPRPLAQASVGDPVLVAGQPAVVERRWRDSCGTNLIVRLRDGVHCGDARMLRLPRWTEQRR